MSRSASSRHDLAVSISDGCVAAFAVFTLLCNAVVAVRGSFDLLLLLSPWVIPVSGLLLFAVRRLELRLGGSKVPRDPGSKSPPIDADRVLIGGAICASIVGSLAEIGWGLEWVWAGSVALLSFGLYTEWSADSPRPEPLARRDPSWHTTLWILVALGAALQLFFHRASIDDSLYLSFTVQALDHPGEPILSSDALHGIPGLPIILPVYRVVSFEMLAATISRLTGLTPLETHHWVLAALFGGLVPLAHARVMQTWTPRSWIYGTVASLFVLLTMAGPARSFGNTTLVLLHQGKGAFLAVMAPLVLAYAAGFSRAPGPGTWLRLYLAQIACVGMTATALWVAPAIAGLTLLATLPWKRHSAITLGLGILASAHPLLFGLAMRASTSVAVASISPGIGSLDLLTAAAESLFGDGMFRGLGFAILAGVWLTCPPGLPRRLAIVFPLGFFLVLFNPLSAAWIAANITGEWTNFRVFWVLPIPFLCALLVSAAFLRGGVRERPVSSGTFAVIAALALGASTTPFFLHSPDNATRFELLGLKARPSELAAARAAVANTGRSGLILAPEPVSVWIGTLREHPASVLPRRLYLDILRPTVGEDEFAWRTELALPIERAIDRVWRFPTSWTERLLRHRVTTVCLARMARGFSELGAALEEAGFDRVASLPEYTIWSRLSAPIEDTPSADAS